MGGNISNTRPDLNDGPMLLSSRPENVLLENNDLSAS